VLSRTEKTFEDFWKDYAGCPRCGKSQSDAPKLAASNAWYAQQEKINELRIVIKAHEHILKAAKLWIEHGISEGNEKDVITNLRKIVEERESVPPYFKEKFRKHFNDILA